MLNCEDQSCLHIILRSSNCIRPFIYFLVFFTIYPVRVYYELTKWRDSLVGRALHRYRSGHGFESRSGRLNIFQALFHNCLTCMHNCDDQSNIYIILRSSNIWTFLYSLICIFLSCCGNGTYVSLTIRKPNFVLLTCVLWFLVTKGSRVFEKKGK